jgi:general secretion pathway protein L
LAEDVSSSAGAELARRDWAYVLTHNGLSVAAHGRAALPLLPAADVVVAVPAQADVSWMRLRVPKAPAAKLKAALSGVLEDQMLADLSAVHLALAPQAKAQDEAWVAVLDKPWLQACLRALEASSRAVDRVSPVLAPNDEWTGHFSSQASQELASEPLPEPVADAANLSLTLCDVQGVVCTPVAGTVARQMVQALAAQPVRWTATPAASAAAERWLGMPVQVESDAQRSLRAVRSAWNLLQFDLAPARRGARMGRLALQAWWSPPWRPVRWGLLGLVLVQWVALNLWAWTQQKALDDLKRAQVALAQSTHPQMRVVVDAPLQMQRETEALRAAAGVPGAQDLEALLGAAASAWPQGQGPAPSLRFDPGQLSVATSGWSESEQQEFAGRLRSQGWRVETAPGRVTLSPAAVRPVATSTEGRS